MHKTSLVIVAVALFGAASSGFAQDLQKGWPQILGPNRDGRLPDAAIPVWSHEPTIRWRIPCGAGYSGVAVSGGKVFLWHRESAKEILAAFDVKNGQPIWRAAFDASYAGGIDPDRGPRATPVVHGDWVYVYGAAGDLHSVSIKDGTIRWSKSLRQDFGAEDGYFGAGSTPVIVEDQIVVCVGGEPNAGLVALDCNSGEVRWAKVDQEASYSSPVVARIKGKTKIIAALRLQTVIVDPSTGEVERAIPFGQRGPTVNAATPLVSDGRMFLTSSYGIGNRMIDLESIELTSLWEKDDVIRSQYVTPVLVNGYLYAMDGREDMGLATLKCVRWDDGAVQWQKESYGIAHLLADPERILAQHVNGDLQVLKADATSFTLLAEAKLPEGAYRALPAFENGMLFCRRTTSASTGEILAIDLRGR